MIRLSLYLFVFLIAFTACSRNAVPDSSIEVAVKGLHCAAISEDSNSAIACSIYHGGSLWRIGDAERIYNWNHKDAEQSTLIAADFSDNNRWALTASVSDLVLWNLNNGQGERYWLAPGEILDAELNHDASLALLGLSDHSAVIFDIRRGGVRRVFQHSNRVRSVDFDARGRLALTGSEDYTAALWDVASGNLLKRIKHNDDVQFVKLSEDGSLALSMSKYDKALIWHTESGEQLGEVPLSAEGVKRGLRFTAAKFSQDNRRLITGRPDQIVQLWDIESMQEIYRWELPKRDKWKPTGASVLDVSFVDESHFLAVASNGFIHALSTKPQPAPQ